MISRVALIVSSFAGLVLAVVSCAMWLRTINLTSSGSLQADRLSSQAILIRDTARFLAAADAAQARYMVSGAVKDLREYRHAKASMVGTFAAYERSAKIDARNLRLVIEERLANWDQLVDRRRDGFESAAPVIALGRDDPLRERFTRLVSAETAQLTAASEHLRTARLEREHSAWWTPWATLSGSLLFGICGILAARRSLRVRVESGGARPTHIRDAA